MNSPTAVDSVLKTKNSQSISLMSTSLKERLKKCGRYHPGISSCESSTGTTSGASQLHSPDSRATRDLHADEQVNETCSIINNDSDTPKRRHSETLNNVSMNNSTDIIKRRKLDYTKRFLNKQDITHHVDVELSSPSSPQKMEADSKLEALRELKNQTNDHVLSCSGADQSEYGEDVQSSSANVKGSDLPAGCSSPDQQYSSLKNVKVQLERDLKVKEEQMRKLKMVKMYREKNNLTELQSLINTWRDVSQRALVDLQALHPPPRPSLTELINHLQIDHELIHYVADEEVFS